MQVVLASYAGAGYDVGVPSPGALCATPIKKDSA
jgi:hypothetical protein